MAKTLSCADFNPDCAFQITTNDGQEDMIVDMATVHARAYHADQVADEPQFRAAIRAHISELMTQAKMAPSEAGETGR